MQAEFKKLHANQLFLRDCIHTGSKQFDHRIHKLQDDLGKKPSNLEARFDTPSIWGTVGELYNTVSSNKDVKGNSLGIQENNLKKLPQTNRNAILKDTATRCDTFKNTLVNVSKSLNFS